MTGFGSARHRGRGPALDVHVKSVNGRFLELRFHLPKEFAPFESDLRRAFAGFARGTLDVYVQRRPERRADVPNVRVNEALARHWARTLRDVNARLKFSDPVTLRDVLAMPQVLETHDDAPDVAGELTPLVRTLRRAALACAKLRAAEGARLKRELSRLLGELDRLAARMVRDQAGARRRTEAKLGRRVESLVGERVDPTRLAVEAALVVDRADVHEELVRLREHVRACRGLMGERGARGKQLDFYGQELLREVNTIGSKAQGASLTQVVVAAKSVIEKFREQVQNIE